MKRPLFLLVTSALGLLLCAVTQPAAAQELFYQGKTIRIIVGSDPGGGFDTYSRTIARHMSKHIPGNPVILVENMPGAAQMIAANYLYKVAKPDGLTLGNFAGTLSWARCHGPAGRRVRRAQIRVSRRAGARLQHLHIEQAHRHRKLAAVVGREESGEDRRHRTGRFYL